MSIENKGALIQEKMFLNTPHVIRDKFKSFGWQYVNQIYSNQYKSMIFNFERDTDIKNYEQVKVLENKYNDIESELLYGKYYINEKLKVKNLSLVPTLVTCLFLIPGLIFGLIITLVGYGAISTGPGLFQLGLIMIVFNIVLLIFKKIYDNKKSKEILQKTQELETIKLEAKKLL